VAASVHADTPNCGEPVRTDQQPHTPLPWTWPAPPEAVQRSNPRPGARSTRRRHRDRTALRTADAAFGQAWAQDAPSTVRALRSGPPEAIATKKEK